MGIALPQVVTSDRASGAQVIDGSLKFVDGSSQQLTKTFSSAGNRRTNTFSCWIKRSGVQLENIFSASSGTGTNHNFIRFNSGKIEFYMNETSEGSKVPAVQHRDIGWYHLVFIIDTTNSTADDRMRIYVNSVRLAPPLTTFDTSNNPSQNYEGYFGSNVKHTIGSKHNDSQYYDGQMSQVYFIDGLALEPENFGFTDPLTNTWRPKKFSGTFPSDTAASSIFSSNTLLTWAGGTTESNWALSNSNKTATYSGSSSYSDVYTAALNSSTTYAFRLTSTGVDSNGGWFFTASTGVSGTHPDERGGDTLGQRANETTLGAHGTFATANSVSAGQGAMSGFGDSQPSAGSGIDFIVNMTARKVWVKAASSGSYVGGGDPTNSSSTASFLLPSGTIYFGNVQYDGGTVTYGDDATFNQSFYLPMDGNSPIGEDKSGKGNNWTPVNFGGSVALDNPHVSGARPILNTLPGGTQAGVGVFGSKENVGYAVTVAPKTGGGNAYYLDGVERPALTGLIRGATYTFNTTDSTNDTHPFVFGTTAEGDNYNDGVARSHNDGTTWSSSVTATNGFKSGLPASQAFDGDEDTRAGNDNSSGAGNLTFTLDLKNVHKVEVRTGLNNTVTINGSTNAGTAALDPQYIVYEPGSTFNLTEIKITSNGQSGYRSDLFAIKVDNVLLRDSTDNRYTAITVPHNAPNTLYYHCGVHSGMGNSISDITTDETKADPYAWRNVLALPLVGSNSDLSNSVNCTSTTKGMTNRGDAAASSDTSNFYVGSFEFDGSGDSITSPYRSDFDFTSGDFTVECWVRQDDTSSFDVFVGKYGGSSSGEFIVGKNANTPTFYWQDSSGNANINATNFRGNTSSWYHMACVREGNVFTMYINGVCENSTTDSTTIKTTNMKLSIGSENGASDSPFDGYLQDVRIYKGVAKYSGTTVGTQYFVPASTSPDILPDTPSGVSGSSELTKITDGAVSFDGSDDYLSFATNSDFGLASGDDFTIECYTYAEAYTNSTSYSEIIRQGTSNAGSDGIFFHVNSSGTVSFRMSGTTKTTTGTVNIGGWNHIAVSRSSGTVYISINGMVENHGSVTNSSTTGDFRIGADFGENNFYKGQLSNVRFVKGTALYTSRFTPPTSALTNVTNTKLLCCQSNISAITAAVSPVTITANGNAVATNFNPFNTDINTVRGQETGYCTFNVLRERTAGYNPTFKDGNLFMDGRGDGTGTLSAQSGKFYFEVTVDTVGSGGQIFLGVQNAAYTGTERNWGNDNIAAIRDTGVFYGTGMTGTAGTYTTGDTLSFAFDVDNNKLYIAKNGVYFNGGVPSQGTGFTHSGINFPGGYTPIVSDSQTGQKYRLNCGQKPFKFPPPDGFQTLNAANVRPETVIARPDQYVGVIKYVGDDATTHAIRGLNFGAKPDLVWIKNRDQTEVQLWKDTVRGVASAIYSSSTQAADTGSTYSDRFPSFDFNGFTVGSSHSGSNSDGDNFVAWCWKAGGNKNTFNVDDVGYASAAAAGLDGGSLAVTGASVGTKQGFSIIKFASGSSGNKTLSHGLLETPTFILVKTTGASSDWSIYHKDLGGTVNNYLVFGTAANATASNIWGAAVPTSSVFGINPGTTCATSQDVIAYLWHDVPGLQKFGSFEGNDNANGTFVELGFKPAIVWVKAIDSAATVGGSAATSWGMWDSARMPNNPAGNPLFANLGTDENVRGNGSSANTGGSDGNGLDGFLLVDMLSNGFKCRTGAAEINDSQTHIYCAWAESPTVNLYGGQSNAR